MYMKKIKELIRDAEIISFDIFDTLILRTYNKPTDLFKHIEVSKQISDFCTLRQKAEYNARIKNAARGIEEVTLEEIYQELPCTFQNIKELEIAQEKACCFADKTMYHLFDYAKKLHKRIIIASDMYLPQYVVEEILQKANYTDYEKLFLSSEIKQTKATGAMFDTIIRYSNTSADKILHIGDNLLTDNDIPSNLGMKTFHYLTAGDDAYKNDFLFFKALDEKVSDRISLSVLKGLLIKRNQSEKNFWEDFGYKYAGLLSVGFCQWLKKEFDKNEINHAYFMSRDGFIPQKVFNALYPNYPTIYMNASRRCYLLSGMKNLEDIVLYLVNLGTEGISFEEYWSALELDHKELYDNFKKTFPEQKRLITAKTKSKIKDFFYKNLDLLKQVSETERKIAIEYFDKIGLLKNSAALIDIGWRGSVQKSIERTCKISSQKTKIQGYYLGTHEYERENSKIFSYSINQGKPEKLANIINPILPLLELIFTAPEAGVVKLFKDIKGIKAKYQDLNSNEEKRINISKDICTGIMDFTKDWLQINELLPINIDVESSLLPLAEFKYRANNETLRICGKILYTKQIGNSKQALPIFPNYNPTKTIGIIYSFPGNMSAERELALRFKKAAENIGYKIIVINNDGFLLDDKTNLTGERIQDDNFKFIISEHYTDYKILDNFYYHTLWNPPEHLLKYDTGYLLLNKNIQSNDDFLIYDSGGMTQHLQAMLIDEPRDLTHPSCLLGSFPKSEIRKVNLNDPKLFYCGMNWEYYAGEARHSGLFHLLDDADLISIYGPSKLSGTEIIPWAGYKNYKCEIPFDGFSILDEINKCGVVLAVSSDAHRRAGAVTNRVYEACAAGAVIISDDNPFMKEHFGNTVLYVDFNKNNPFDTYRQIVEKLQWIKHNKTEAAQLARASQKIFIDNFCMEVQLQKVIDNHENRKQAAAKALYAQKNDETVLVVTYFDTPEFSAPEYYRLQNIFEQIRKQNYKNTVLTIACDDNIVDEIQNLVPQDMVNVIVQSFRIFNKKHSKMLTRGQILRNLMKQINPSYFVIMQGTEIFFKDHLSVLKRKLEDNPDEYIVHSGSFVETKGQVRIPQFRGSISPELIHGCMVNPDGMFMVSAQAEELLPYFVDSNLDGYELYAYLNRIYFKHKKQMLYSNHITCGVKEQRPVRYISPLLSEKMQISFIQGLVLTSFENWCSLYRPIQQEAKFINPINPLIVKKVKKIIRTRLSMKIILLKVLRSLVFSKKLRKRLKKQIKKKEAELIELKYN